MSFFRKLFTSAPAKQQRSDALAIYLDADLKKSIEARDQLVREYETENNFDEDQFLYLLVVARKGGEVQLKRRLNGFERLGECVKVGEQQRAFVVVGQGAERSTIPRIAAQVPGAEGLKFMRSGTVSRFNEAKSNFEECQLKLHHDYLTFYKFKESQRKVSFVPLENSVVEVVNEKKNMFSVKDKFNSTVFRTTSKEDMFGWLYAITEAIKIRNSQIYMNDMEDKLAKATRNHLNDYLAKCAAIKDHSRILPLDDIGRKALRAYFRSHPVPPQDAALLSLIEAYLHMCRCRREKGEAHSEQILEQIRRSMQEMKFPPEIPPRDLSSKTEFVKTIEEVMKYLDQKYRREIIDKKNMHAVFQGYLLDQYRQDRPLPLKTLFGADPS